MASCGRPDLKQMLYRFVRGELDDPAARAAVEEHLKECAACAGVHGELQWLLGTMRGPAGADAGTLLRELDGPSREAELAGARHAPPGGGWLRRFRHWLSTGARARK